MAPWPARAPSAGKADPANNDEAFAFLRITVMDPDAKKAGKLFSARVVEMALASIPGFTLTAPPNAGSPAVVHWPALVSNRFIQQPVAGDKGGNANLGVWAQTPEAYAFLRGFLTTGKLHTGVDSAKGPRGRKGHEHVRKAVRDFVNKRINPFVDEWEAAGIAPLHDLFREMGQLGFLGIRYDPKYGGEVLDYWYETVMLEEISHIKCGALPMAIAVQTNMATPAIRCTAEWGS